MPTFSLPGQAQPGVHTGKCVHSSSQSRRPQLHSSALQGRASHVPPAQRCRSWNRSSGTRTRCQASEGNNKPGMLWGLRNAFHGLGFGSAPSESNAKQPEQEAQPQAASDTPHSFDSATPWNSWSQYFDEMDESAQKLEELGETLTQATLLERFGEAAKVKQEMDDINSSDVVEAILEEYDDAVQSEDYSKAAALRDAGATGLLGWWVSQNKGDPHGHLLHIVPAFSRYVGYAFSPKDLARAEGIPLEESTAMASSADEIQPIPLHEVGSPVMELFLRKDANGQLQQQGTALSVSSNALAKIQSSLDNLDPDKVSVKEKQDANGNPVISIQVNLAAEDPAAVALEQQLQALQPGQAYELGQGGFNSPSSLTAESFATSLSPPPALTDADVIDLQRMPAQIIQPSRNELEVSLKPLTAEQQAEFEQEQDKARRQELVYDSRDHDSDDENEEDSVMAAVDEPAADQKRQHNFAWSRDIILFSGSPSQPSGPGMADASQRQEASDAQVQQPEASSTGSGDGQVHVSIDDIASSSQRNEERGGDSQVEEELPSWETVVGQVLGVVQQLKRVAPNPGPTVEDKQRHLDLMQQLDEAEDALTPKGKAKSPKQPDSPSMSVRPSETQQQSESKQRAQTPTPPPSNPSASPQDIQIQALFDAMHAQRQPAEVPLDADGNNINQVVSKLAGQVLKGALPELTNNGTDASLAQTASGKIEGTVMKYRRLDTDFVTTDPFTGLFLAAFGTPGPELLQLQRQTDPVDETIEWLVGTKLTGDSHVPAGEVSFKARIGRGSRLGAADMYTPEMGVIARYKGSGCVVQPGFQQPTWVDGELLHLSGEGTRGAELGFVWNEKQSFVLAVLKRVDLSGNE